MNSSRDNNARLIQDTCTSGNDAQQFQRRTA
jgi:hypothetical protein